MKIIILGAGQVGSSLLASLAGENNDIVMVDIRPDLLSKLQDRFDIRTVQGNAAHPTVLQNAGAAEAEMLIAATSDDETNMLACQMALPPEERRQSRVSALRRLLGRPVFPDEESS